MKLRNHENEKNGSHATHQTILQDQRINKKKSNPTLQKIKTTFIIYKLKIIYSFQVGKKYIKNLSGKH